MKWVSTVVDHARLEDAVPAAVEELRARLGKKRPDLLVVFASPHHQDGFEDLPDLLRKELDPRVLVGCSGGGVIGGGHEVENRPGLSLTAAVLPGVSLVPFHIKVEDLPDVEASREEWERLVKTFDREKPHFLLLPDPFTFNPDLFLRGLDRAFPESRKVGGLASGGGDGDPNSLFLNDEVHNAGLVGVGMFGNLQVDTLVAQGCRPVGEPIFVTKCRGNLLFEVDGRPVSDYLADLYGSLESRDRELFQHSLFLGMVMKEFQPEYRHGDFLIRNLLGMDRKSGALAIGGGLRVNQVAQFHLRDARTSAEDLDGLLSRYRTDSGESLPHGSLMFSCLGRGMHLYGRPDHDTDSFRRHLGEIPLGGFFCSGEIGPVQGKTFLHGYTSSFALFRNLT